MYDAENVAFKFSRLRRHLKRFLSENLWFYDIWGVSERVYKINQAQLQTNEVNH